MSPGTINIITNIVGVLLAILEPLRAYLGSQPFNWTTFAMCIGGAIIAYFTSKGSQNILNNNNQLMTNEKIKQSKR